MSVESKLDAVLSNQAALATAVGSVLTAVQNIPGANTQAVTDALAQIETQVADIKSTIGTEAAPAGAAA